MPKIVTVTRHKYDFSIACRAVFVHGLPLVSTRSTHLATQAYVRLTLLSRQTAKRHWVAESDPVLIRSSKALLQMSMLVEMLEEVWVNSPPPPALEKV